ncbi:hypothetical protein ACNKHU_25790 [Shigella flexneri]
MPCSLLGTLIVRSGILVFGSCVALDNVCVVPLFSLFALISLRLWLCMAGERGRWPGGASSGLSREMLILATLLLFCAVLLMVLVGNSLSDDLGFSAGDASPLACRILTARRYRFGLLMWVVIVLATVVSGNACSFRRW